MEFRLFTIFSTTQKSRLLPAVNHILKNSAR
jgi:hypothetical protein